MRRIGTLGLAMVFASSLALAQDAQVRDAGTMLSPGMLGWDHHGSGVSQFISGTDITGHVDTGFTFNFNNSNASNSATGTTVENPGRIFDQRHNEWMLNSFMLDFNRGTTADSIFGYHVTMMMGDDARSTNAASPTADDVFGDQDFTLSNANIQIQLPDSAGPLSGAVVTVGRFETTIGAETLHSPQNDNYSRSYLFGLAIPFTHTGVPVSKSGIVSSGDSDVVNARLGWVNGWDSINDNNNSGTLLAGGDLNPTDFFSLDLDAAFGAEQSEGTSGANSDKRTVVDLVATLGAPDDVASGGAEFLRRLKLLLNVTWGGEEGVGAGAAEEWATWYGFAAILRYDFDLPILGSDGSNDGRWFLALRGEWMEDPDGSRIGPGVAFPANDHAQVWGVTGTLGFRPADLLLIRLEVRHDHGETKQLGVNSKPFADGSRNSQTTVALNVVANL